MVQVPVIEVETSSDPAHESLWETGVRMCKHQLWQDLQEQGQFEAACEELWANLFLFKSRLFKILQH